MKSSILPVLINAILFSIISSIVVVIIGLMRKWQTPAQYSDGFFWAGAIIVTVGFVNLFGMFSQRTVSGLPYSQSAVHLDASERLKIWNADILRSYNLLAILLISSLLLFGLSGLVILIGRAL